MLIERHGVDCGNNYVPKGCGMMTLWQDFGEDALPIFSYVELLPSGCHDGSEHVPAPAHNQPADVDMLGANQLICVSSVNS
eukprot:1148411-Pelagomonas_calceolata.AAC.4